MQGFRKIVIKNLMFNCLSTIYVNSYMDLYIKPVYMGEIWYVGYIMMMMYKLY